MKYKKKPITVEAEQYTQYNPLPKGVCVKPCIDGVSKPHVHTIHKGQIVLLEDGDYVIEESDGCHYYPCKPDVFNNTYDPV